MGAVSSVSCLPAPWLDAKAGAARPSWLEQRHGRPALGSSKGRRREDIKPLRLSGACSVCSGRLPWPSVMA